MRDTFVSDSQFELVLKNCTYENYKESSIETGNY